MSYNVTKRIAKTEPVVKVDAKKFQTFEDLEAYKGAREFRKAMYAICKRLPDFEKFGLISQIRRAALSLTNNIAEGHGRYHYPDQIKFCLQARGSLQELIDDLNTCADEKYLPDVEINDLKQTAWQVLHLINSYIRHLRARLAEKNSSLHETAPAYSSHKDDLASEMEL
jgi:four helix bundle protein